MDNRGARNLPSLTGLRYWAAATVVVHHATPVFGVGTYADHLSAVGYVGVAFFFTLSGFILTWTRDPSTSKKTFYRRRFARIYPLYVTTWVAAIAAAYLVHIPGKSTLGAVLGFVMLQAWVPILAVYGAGNAPGWSLSAEAFFYAVFPFLVTRLPRARWAAPALVAAITVGGALYGVSSGYSQWFAYYSPICGLLFFVTGMMLAGVVRDARVRVPSLPVAVAALAAAYFLLGTFAWQKTNGFVEALILPFIAVVIVAAARADLVGGRTFWARPVLVRLGQWSFALYLVHYSFIRLLPRLVPVHFGSAMTIVLDLVFLAFATAVAAGAYYVIERPFEKRIRGVARKPEPVALAADPM